MNIPYVLRGGVNFVSERGMWMDDDAGQEGVGSYMVTGSRYRKKILGKVGSRDAVVSGILAELARMVVIFCYVRDALET
jgi:hypothetical protein